MIDGDVAGFPNGRRLDDDIVDIALRVVMGVLLPDHDSDADSLGDGVAANDVSFNAEFPYVAYPHSGSDRTPTEEAETGGGRVRTPFSSLRGGRRRDDDSHAP